MHNPTPPRDLANASDEYRVRTLTGKEIELDIEPDYKVRRVCSRFPGENCAGKVCVGYVADGDC